LFTGEELSTSRATNQPLDRSFDPGGTYGIRHRVISGYEMRSADSGTHNAKITMVEDNV
jgi:hypothetical protein